MMVIILPHLPRRLFDVGAACVLRFATASASAHWLAARAGTLYITLPRTAFNNKLHGDKRNYTLTMINLFQNSAKWCRVDFRLIMP